MKKNNEKGFTLLELIITLSIFTVVILGGYRVFNKYISTLNIQNNINQGQLIINNINEFMTKDLERANSITLQCIDPKESQVYTVKNNEEGKENYLEIALNEIKERNKINKGEGENNLIYKYTINMSDESKSPSYIVELKHKKDSIYIQYSVYRIAPEEPEIRFVTNNKTKIEGDNFNTPLIISKNNPYLVTASYEESLDKSNTYEFEVVSRIISGSGGNSEFIPKPPSTPEPPGFNENYTAVGFWTADKSKCVKDNLYTWIQYQSQVDSQYGQQEIDKAIFDINANLSSNDSNSPNDNSGRIFSHIGYTDSWKANASLKGEKAGDIKKIQIYVDSFTTLNNIKDNGEVVDEINKIGSGSGTVFGNSRDGWILYGGSDTGTWYEVKLSNDKKKNFNIYGELSIDESQTSSGYAVIFYGESDN